MRDEIIIAAATTVIGGAASLVGAIISMLVNRVKKLVSDVDAAHEKLRKADERFAAIAKALSRLPK